MESFSLNLIEMTFQCVLVTNLPWRSYQHINTHSWVENLLGEWYTYHHGSWLVIFGTFVRFLSIGSPRKFRKIATQLTSRSKPQGSKHIIGPLSADTFSFQFPHSVQHFNKVLFALWVLFVCGPIFWLDVAHSIAPMKKKLRGISASKKGMGGQQLK